ncbi:condensin complex subunit 1 isoform X1 [Hydra vulgaris]|nr:condensin complex subunit 1 isoform X1 [Hydra vulgaris]
MEYEFHIPLTRDDLLSTSTDGFSIKNVLEPSCLDDKLDEANSDFKSEGVVAIVTHFDIFFSVLSHMKRLQEDIKQTAWQIIASNLELFTNFLPIYLDPDGIDTQLRCNLLCALKMECYIVCQFIEEFEIDATKPEVNTGTKKGGKKKKAIANWSWESERRNALVALNKLVQLDLFRLWDPPIVEEDFVNLVSGICYKLFENANFVRQKEDRDIVLHTLGHLIKRYNHQQSASVKIVQLLQHFEYLVSPLSHALEIFVNEYGAKLLVCDIIREIGRIDMSDLTRDASGTRSFSQFLVEIAEKIPSSVLPNISLLMAHLDGESYSMRNGVLGVFGEIVAKVLNKDNLDVGMKKSREGFLDRLEDHIHDVNSFVRSRVLQIWLYLCHEKAIPIARQGRLLDLVIGRLQDKSSQVRKYAVQFLKASLVGNPFAAKLPIDQLTQSLEKEMEKLKEIDQSDNNDVINVVQDSEEWLQIKDSMKQAINQFLTGESMEEDSEDDEIYEDDEDGFKKALIYIQSLIKNSAFHKSVVAFSKVLRIWNEIEDLQLTDVEIEKCKKSDFQNVENKEQENDEDEDSQSEDESEAQKKEDQKTNKVLQIKYYLLMKKIFHVADTCTTDIKIDLATVDLEQSNKDQVNVNLEKQKVLVTYLSDCVRYAKQMKMVVPVLCQLLGSKINCDVLEAIDFFIAAYEFGLSQSEEGIRRMATLIWSSDPAIKKCVIAAFERLYLEVPCDNVRNKPTLIVKSLISLITKANLGELTSLEKLLCELMKLELIPQSVIHLLWQIFSLKIPQTSKEEQRAALNILSMLGGAEKEIIQSNINILIEYGLQDSDSFILARDTCISILKLTKNNSNDLKESSRLSTDHLLFITLERLLVDGLKKLETRTWTPFSEQAFSVIYNLAENPDIICARILKHLVVVLKNVNIHSIEQDIFSQASDDIASSSKNNCVHQRVVARVLTAAGHISLLQLFHLDVSIFTELKRRNRIEQEDKEKNDLKARKASRASKRESTASSIISKTETGLDDELGVGGAVVEDAEAENIRKICERDIVTGSNLLSIFCPVAALICSNPSKYKHVELQSAAALALGKFMLVSSECCDAHLQLMFTILGKSDTASIRTNAMIICGDLTFRFPNLIEPWTPHLYARLRDESLDVRSTAVKILAHLILNDMVKVKGQISEMAVCLEDKEEKISSAAKLFFFELSQKGNALYNIVPDIISRLSDHDQGIEEKLFRSIMKYLLQFIQKDKHSESLIEKLCHRYRVTRTDRQWRDLSYCLSLLPYNEKSFKKLIENIGCFQSQLSDDEIYNCFTTIVAKLKKFAKIEMKALLEEFESTLEGFHKIGVTDNNDDVNKAAKALSLAASQGNKKAGDTKRGSTKKKGGRTKPQDNDGDKIDKENEPPSNVKRKVSERNKKIVQLNPIFSSDDDDFS